MKNRVVINIHREEYGDIQRFIDLGKPVEDVSRDKTWKIFQADFGNGIEADLMVMNGDRPYVSAVLYVNDVEFTTLDPVEELLGEHTFEYNGDQYTVEISLSLPTVGQLADELGRKIKNNN